MDSSLHPIYAYCLKILSGKDIPERTVRQKIHAKHPTLTHDEVDEVIDLLKKEKFIDDDRFIENFVYWRKTAMPRGKRMIVQELIQKKIDSSIAAQRCEELISYMDELNMCTDLGEHKWNTLQLVEDSNKRKEKFIRFLAGKHFPFDIILQVYESVKNKKPLNE